MHVFRELLTFCLYAFVEWLIYIITLPPHRGVKYCNEHVCLLAYMSQKPHV